MGHEKKEKFQRLSWQAVELRPCNQFPQETKNIEFFEMNKCNRKQWTSKSLLTF